MGTPSAGGESADVLPVQDAVLIAPARAQLVTLAADVVARLPVEDVPPSLRAIARFAPAKRARLGGVALAAALDSDEAFRAAVADVVGATSPELTGAVRDGGPTAAADPVDVAVVAYLTRPEGWTDVLAGAAARWRAEQGPSEGTRQELDRLRAELAALRSEAKGEAARLREAVQAAVQEAAAELIELRRTVRLRTGELRSAERAAVAARQETVAARAAVAAAAAALETERGRHREQLLESERAAEGTRRSARVERDLDDARLWLLTDTLIQAAAGVRRELALAPPSLRPADTVTPDDVGAAATTRPGAAAAGPVDVAGLDRVLALPHAHLIVDGYNVTKTAYPQLSLIDQRTRLTGSLAPLAARSGAEITVVFDGATRPPAQPAAPRGVRVLFSAADEIADDLIRRLVAAEPPGRPVLVATSDRQIVTDVVRDGARAVASAVLAARLA